MLNDFLAQAVPLAIDAGRAILAVSEEAMDIREKSDGSPLTRADLASHETIMAGLAGLQPAYPILSEESVEDFDIAQAGAVYWCVDPLDGTKEFVKQRDEYTVNIALVRAGAPILGIIYVPALDRLYYAADECGAWRVDEAVGSGGGWPFDEAVQLPIRKPSDGEPLIAVISRSHPSVETDAFLKRESITEVLRHGSSLKLCAVADGSADVYPRFGPTCLWDTAAGAAIARNAGGKVVTPAGGKPLRYELGAGLKHSGFIVYRPERIQPGFE